MVRTPRFLPCGLASQVGVVALLAASGCYATRTLPAPSPSGDVGVLQRGGQSDQVILGEGQRHEVRIRPGSWIRFRRADGAWTAWTEARRLRVTPQFALVEATGGAAPALLRWNDVAAIEVNDLDMGRTMIGVVGGTTVVILALATEVMIVGALSALTGGHGGGGDIGLTRSALQVVVERAGERPPDDQPLLRPDGVGDVALVAAAGTAPQPLFSWQARRRDVLRLGAEIEMGLATGDAAVRAEATVTAGLRLWNVLELGGGVSVLSDPGAPTRVGDAPAATMRIVPLVRAGLHLGLDPGGRIALALGQEIGFAGGGWLDARTRWGLRFRVGDRWQLGVYPVNPRTVWVSDGARPRTVFVSTFELGWTL